MHRLILIKFPLKAKQILTPHTTLIAILLIYIFSIVYCIPYWLEQRYIPELKQCRLTNIGKKIHKYTRIYIYIPVVYLIPFITLTCINITIIQYLIAKKRRKKSLGAKTNKKKQADYYITLMLVTVIIVFVLCQLPLLILNAWYAIDPVGSYHSLLFHSLNSIGILLIVCNTSTNFLLYCFFGQKFRQTLIEFILNFLPNHNKQSNLATRISKLTESQSQITQLSIKKPQINLQPLPPPPPLPPPLSEPTQRISSGNSSTTTTTTNDLKKSTELNKNQDEAYPLITDSKQMSIINEKFPFKPDQKLNLYTCANGKRILVLKI